MDINNLKRNSRIFFSSFALGVTIGLSSGASTVSFVSSGLQSASMSPALAEGLSTLGIGVLGTVPGITAMKDSIPKTGNEKSFDLVSKGLLFGLTTGMGVSAFGSYLVSHPETWNFTKLLCTTYCATIVATEVALKNNLFGKLYDKARDLFHKDTNKNINNDKNVSKNRSREKEIYNEISHNNEKQSNSLSLRESLTKSQKGLCSTIENWAEQNHINDKNGNLLKFDETIGSARDAMNQLVSEAKANGFKIKATEKPLSHTVQNDLSKNSNEAER